MLHLTLFVGGLVGNDLLRRFNLILNYPNAGNIPHSPIAITMISFDYAYTGLGIYYVGGKIVIEDVVPGSPADLGHFKVGMMRYCSVGTNFSHNIQVYKNILQNPNEDIKVLVNREWEDWYC